MSQSLPLFRAFQQNICICTNCYLSISRNPFLYSGHFNKGEPSFKFFTKAMSQSLPLFRAFQQNKREVWNKRYILGGRNPFLYSGHFNKILKKNIRNRIIIYVAIPSFIQGISTLGGGRYRERVEGVAIPSFIQGISTRRWVSWGVSCFISRNPFLYSGHFNCCPHFGNTCGYRVAIPSFIQGISTKREYLYLSLLIILSQSLPLFRAFQHLLTDFLIINIYSMSQSLPLFRAFQPGVGRVGSRRP